MHSFLQKVRPIPKWYFFESLRGGTRLCVYNLKSLIVLQANLSAPLEEEEKANRFFFHIFRVFFLLGVFSFNFPGKNKELSFWGYFTGCVCVYYGVFLLEIISTKKPYFEMAGQLSFSSLN